MKLRTAASIALIVFAAGLCFWMFVRPVIKPAAPEIVDESQLIYMGDDAETGEPGYFVFKEEVKDWFKILAPFAPAISLLLAYFLKGKKR